MRNTFFLKNHIQKSEEARSRLLCRKPKLSILMDHQSERNVIKFIFILFSNRGLPKYVKTKMLITSINLNKT